MDKLSFVSEIKLNSFGVLSLAVTFTSKVFTSFNNPSFRVIVILTIPFASFTVVRLKSLIQLFASNNPDQFGVTVKIFVSFDSIVKFKSLLSMSEIFIS